MIKTAWRKKHKEIIDDFLFFLNKRTNNYILKGGTSLMKCYGLDRFSEDIDLDSTDHKTINDIISNYCKNNNYEYRIAKDTMTVKRFFIDYRNEIKTKPLKIEISYRRRSIPSDEVAIINDINVYKLNEIAIMKINTYNNRDKIRDLYDIAFICNTYFDNLTPQVKQMFRNSLEYKGLEQVDYLIQTQSDELIDNEKLIVDVLNMFDKLELLVSLD